MIERRHPSPAKGSELPADYISMIEEVFATNFDEGLKLLNAIQPGSRFQASGMIYPEEVIVSVSIVHDKRLAATTVHASMDFDPKASSPTLQDLLGSCVDVIGGIFLELLDAKNRERVESLASESLSALDQLPVQWTAISLEKRRAFVRVDKTNPNLDKMADDWLEKNDPDHAERLLEEAKATEELFFTGPKKTVH